MGCTQSTLNSLKAIEKPIITKSLNKNTTKGTQTESTVDSGSREQILSPNKLKKNTIDKSIQKKQMIEKSTQKSI